MKKIYFFIIVLSVFSCSTKNDSLLKEGHFLISGTVNGLASGELELKFPSLKIPVKTKIINGKFKLSGQLAAPELVEATLLPDDLFFSVFIEDSIIQLDIDTSKLSALKEPIVNVSGSKSHKEYEALSKALTKKDNPIDYLVSYIKDNPKSIVAAYFLDLYGEELNDITLATVIDLFDDGIKNSIQYKKLESRLNILERIKVGKLVPDFTLKTPDNKDLSLSSLRGQYVFIDFWASWCVPCRTAFADLKQIYAKYHDKGFEILGVADDNSEQDWRIALEEEQLPWPQVRDNYASIDKVGDTIALYGIEFLPSTLLIDREGKLIVKNPSKELLKSKLEELLKE